MGDHRASIKIEFSMHGHTEKADMWLNYSPEHDGSGYSVDKRVLQWLTDQYDIAMGRYFDAEYDAEKMRRAEEENEERDTLARLKAKYES